MTSTTVGALALASAEAGEDPETRKLFRTGNTMGVFYTESPASRALCIKSKAEEYEILRWILFDNHKLTSYTATERFLKFFRGNAGDPRSDLAPLLRRRHRRPRRPRHRRPPRRTTTRWAR